MYLRQILKTRVYDKDGELIGQINDLAIATREVFPHVTSLAFVGPGRTPFMVSWRKYVDSIDDDRITLNVSASDIRFSYLQPDEVLLARDLLDKQIVDTQGMKVVRVNDLKLSESPAGMRLLGAETGARALLRGLHPLLERVVCRIASALRHPINEQLIAWNYMELVDRDMSQIKLSMDHRRLQELHPADVADIIEHLDPQQRLRVFEQLDLAVAADTISELEDEYQADVIEDMNPRQGAALLAEMEPDDAADIIGDLPYEKAERLLRLMGMDEESTVRSLLGYKEKTAGGIMTTEFVSCPDDMTVEEAIATLREAGDDQSRIHYLYLTTAHGVLTGVLSLRTLVIAKPDQRLEELAYTDLITAPPELDQQECAEMISKYDLMALPVVDERGMMLGIVTFDDAMEVMEEEYEEDMSRRSISSPWVISLIVALLVIIGIMAFMLAR